MQLFDANFSEDEDEDGLSDDTLSCSEEEGDSEEAPLSPSAAHRKDEDMLPWNERNIRMCTSCNKIYAVYSPCYDYPTSSWKCLLCHVFSSDNKSHFS